MQGKIGAQIVRLLSVVRGGSIIILCACTISRVCVCVCVIISSNIHSKGGVVGVDQLACVGVCLKQLQYQES